ncbi:hypothetical protein RJ641_020303 [Dillenia turbinata]|uniref:Uncharacterized protein n=1 Tax=Dillenia turbinata TaxID=194707 RepID=A0AAN8UNR7_9MAGN
MDSATAFPFHSASIRYRLYRSEELEECPYNLRPSSIQPHFRITFKFRIKHRYSSGHRNLIGETSFPERVNIGRFHLVESLRERVRHLLTQTLVTIGHFHYNHLERLVNEILEYGSFIAVQDSNAGMPMVPFCVEIEETFDFVCQERTLVMESLEGRALWIMKALKCAKIEECKIVCSICLEELQDAIAIDEDLQTNSARSLETLVTVGMQLGVSKKSNTETGLPGLENFNLEA